MTMTTLKLTLLALVAAAALPAAGQSNAEVMNEIKALRERVNQLEQQLKESQAKSVAPASPQWGMTPEQAAELNRLTVKTEALEDSREASGFMGLKISGQMQVAYIYNRAQDLAGFQFLDSVANYGYNYWNSYIGMAVLDFQKEMSDGTKWRLTLAPQRGIGSTIDGYSIVHEASISVPLTDLQTRFIAGQLPDWSGYEYYLPRENKLITHNLLFDFTAPTGFIGAGLDITSGKWVTKAVLAQMNQFANNASMKGSVLAARVDYARGEYQGFGMAGVYGQAPNLVNGCTLDPNTGDYGNPCSSSNLGLIEVDGYFIRGDWTVQGQLSYGYQKGAAITPDASGNFKTASWYGLSTLAAYKFTPRLEGVGRFDYLDNSRNGGGLLGYGADSGNGIGPDGNLQCASGFVTGCDEGANRYALAAGLNYVFNQYTMFKAEYRYDWSNLPVFLNVSDGSYRKSNSVLGASVVVSF
jgi:predicted porin